MEYLVTAAEMKEYDKNTIEVIGIPSLVLLERAAIATCGVMKSKIKDIHKKSMLLVCGTGNNGADGMAIGRLFLEEDCNVDFLLMGDLAHYSEEAKKQRKILDAYGVKFLTEFPQTEYDIIVDALFGIGLTRKIEDKNQCVIERINQSKSIIVSVDIPSGVNATDGQILGCAIKAHMTVTYGYMKRGHKIYPGKSCSGEVFCDRIGITEKSFQGKKPVAYTFTEPMKELLPERSQDGNKGTFGKLMIIGGQEEMSGAVQLCAMAAYGSGAGMVKIMTHKGNRAVIQSTIPEAMLFTWEKEIPFEKLEQSLEWADGIVIGPGLGKSKQAKEILEYILIHSQSPIVIDADGLNLISEDESLQNLAKKYFGKHCKAQLILTPHQGELSKLTHIPISDLKMAPTIAAQKVADEWNVIVVSKDATTCVCEKGQDLYINTAGNNGMATAGSGDVLAGIIGALLVQGLGTKSASLGVYLHAKAGDKAAEKKNQYSMTARDIIEGLNEVLR